MSQVDRAKGGEYRSRPDNVIAKNGEYYTTGTQPPDPPPEPKKDKDKGKDSKDDGKKDSNSDKKDSGSKEKKDKKD